MGMSDGFIIKRTKVSHSIVEQRQTTRVTIFKILICQQIYSILQ